MQLQAAESIDVLEKGTMSDFFRWIATIPALVQVPLVVGAFVVVVAVILFFVEIAPRSGRRYTIIRLAVCVIAPLVIFLFLGSVLWAAAAAAVLGGIFFILDYRAKKGAGYLMQLVGFLAPALILPARNQPGQLGPVIQYPLDAADELWSRVKQVGIEHFHRKQRNQPDHRADLEWNAFPLRGK